MPYRCGINATTLGWCLVLVVWMESAIFIYLFDCIGIFYFFDFFDGAQAIPRGMVVYNLLK